MFATIYTVTSSSGTPVAKKIIKRYMPDAHTIREHKYLHMFGKALHDPNLWHMNRHSVSDAFAIGMFMAFVPMPFQMIPAAALAIFFRANIIISVALVWVSNPITMPPLFYFCYLVGTWIVGREANEVTFNISLEWLTSELLIIWQPFLLGCLVVAALCSLASYWGIRGLWRWHVVREWEARKDSRKAGRK